MSSRRNELMKLSKRDLIRKCKECKVSSSGTKREMADRIIAKTSPKNKQNKNKKKMNKSHHPPTSVDSLHRNEELENYIMELLCGIHNDYFKLLTTKTILCKIVERYGDALESDYFMNYFGKTFQKVIDNMQNNKKIRLYKTDAGDFEKEIYGMYNIKSIIDKEKTRKLSKSAGMDRILVYGYCREIEEEYDLFFLIGSDVINLLILFTLKLYTVYAKGKQTVGELGLGNDYELNRWTQLESFSEYISGTDLQHIYLGKQRFTLLDVQNNIYSVGSNMHGDCGVFSTDYGIFQWQMITEYSIYKQAKQIIKHSKDLELEIRTLSNGMSAYHTFVCTKDDRLFVYGNLKANQAGSGLQDICSHQTYSIYPTEITFKFQSVFKNQQQKITQIECGRYHSLFLTDKGNVYSLGKTFKPKTSHWNEGEYDKTPKQIIFGVGGKIIITRICCGFAHNLALTHKNKVYGWGNDIQHGSIGIKPEPFMKFTAGYKSQYYTDKPILNKHLSNIMYISCGYNDSLCIDSRLICYVFGSTAFSTFKQGQNPLISTQNYWGYNHRNRRVANDAYFEPYKFAKEFIKDGCCGYNHTALLTVNNELVIFGTDYGNYRKFSNKEIGMQSNEIIEKVVAGYENIIVISS